MRLGCRPLGLRDSWAEIRRGIELAVVEGPVVIDFEGVSAIFARLNDPAAEEAAG